MDVSKTSAPGSGAPAPIDAPGLESAVSFGRVPDDSESIRTGDPAAVLWQGMNWWLYCFAGVALFLVTRAVNGALAGPSWVPFAFVGVGALAAVAYFVRRSFLDARIRAGATPSGAGQTDPRYRVRCAGWEVPRARLDALGPINGHPFEPRVFAGFFALAPGKRTVRAWVLLTLLFMVVSVVYLVRSPGAGSFVGMVQFPFAAILAGGVVAICLPTYIRVVPGRIDVLQYTALTRRAVRTRSHDLRSARVLVDLNVRTITVHAAPDRPWEAATVRFWFGWMPRGFEFAHAVLEGAVCTAPSPPVPERELLG